MKAQSGFRTRTAAKQGLILSALRRDIVEGRLAPGSQLPTRATLEREFQVSSATLQRALDRLIDHGFVYARGSSGTYVSENPPFLSRFGLVFPYVNNGTNWSRFWVSLRSEAELLTHENPVKSIPLYYGMGDSQPDRNEFDKLLRHLEEHRIAGLIFAGPMFPFKGTPVLDMPGVPRVAIGPADGNGVPIVSLDPLSLLDPALDHFAKSGCKRVALMGHAGLLSNPNYIARWAAGVTNRGMKYDPRWIMGLDVIHPSFARNATHLMMSTSVNERPDAFFIADDNLVEYATAGLVDASAASGVQIVAHCNFPWPTPSVLPAKRLGFDTREALRKCVEIIDIQRAGGRAPEVTEIRPKFEDEMAGAV